MENNSRNSIDRLWFTEYSNDIFHVLKEQEHRRRQFFGRSPQLEYRSFYVDLIRDFASRECPLSRRTVHIAIYILDIFMDNHTIVDCQLHLVAATSIWLAAKFDELNYNVPKINDLNKIREYTRAVYKALEILMLNFFDWNLWIPTAVDFCDYFIEFVTDAQDLEINSANFPCMRQMKKCLAQKVFDYLDLTLLDVRLIHCVLPSKLAASCLAAARFSSSVEPVWSDSLQTLTTYAFADLRDCVIDLISMRTMKPNEFTLATGDMT